MYLCHKNWNLLDKCLLREILTSLLESDVTIELYAEAANYNPVEQFSNPYWLRAAVSRDF